MVNVITRGKRRVGKKVGRTKRFCLVMLSMRRQTLQLVAGVRSLAVKVAREHVVVVGQANMASG